MSAPRVVHSVTVADGRITLGEVEQLANGQHRALSSDGVRLGIFDHQRDAVRRVWEASRSSGQEVAS